MNASKGLRDVPFAWDMIPIKRLFMERDERTATGQEELFALSKSRGLIPRNAVSDKEPRADTLVGYKKFYSGDIVMNKMQAWNGVFGFGETHGIVSPEYTVLKAREADISPHYYCELFRTDIYAGLFGTLARGMGTAFLRLNTDDLGMVLAPKPTSTEQYEITTFIKAANAQAEGLVTKYGRLVELLQEKRDVIISQAVTKGLDFTVPMKDSGVEWIGEIPKAWDIEQLFRGGVKIVIGKVDVNIQDPDGKYPFYTCSREVKKSSSFSFDCEALLIAGNGDVGTTHYTTGKFEAYQRTYVLSSLLNWNVDFLRYYVSTLLLTALKNKSVGSVIQFIALGDLRHFPVVSPPKTEQARIVCYLNKEVSKIERLIAIARRASDITMEHRSALITAAVTGQIDAQTYKSKEVVVPV